MLDLRRKLGERIYAFRKQNRLSQAQLAEKAKISNEFMSAVERGAKLPSLQVLEGIAAALKIEIKDLFNFDRTSYHRLKPVPREVLELAFEIAELSPDHRRKLRAIT